VWKYFGFMWEFIFYCVKDLKNYMFNVDVIKVFVCMGFEWKLVDYCKLVFIVYLFEKVLGNVWYFVWVCYWMFEYEEYLS